MSKYVHGDSDGGLEIHVRQPDGSHVVVDSDKAMPVFKRRAVKQASMTGKLQRVVSRSKAARKKK